MISYLENSEIISIPEEETSIWIQLAVVQPLAMQPEAGGNTEQVKQAHETVAAHASPHKVHLGSHTS